MTLLLKKIIEDRSCNKSYSSFIRLKVNARTLWHSGPRARETGRSSLEDCAQKSGDFPAALSGQQAWCLLKAPEFFSVIKAPENPE